VAEISGKSGAALVQSSLALLSDKKHLQELMMHKEAEDEEDELDELDELDEEENDEREEEELELELDENEERGENEEREENDQEGGKRRRRRRRRRSRRTQTTHPVTRPVPSPTIKVPATDAPLPVPETAAPLPVPIKIPEPFPDTTPASTRVLLDILLKAQGKAGVGIFWPQHGDDKSRCKKMIGDKFFHGRKLTQIQCELRATKRGYPFYSFDASRGMCLLTKSCDKIDSDLKKPFKIFKSSQQFPSDIMLCPGGATLTTRFMTTKDYDQISESVQQQLRGLSATCNSNECQQADWAGCVLRMAGRDFMDFRPNDGGGSDGCLDFSDAGSAPCLSDGEFGQSLKDTYMPVCTKVSLADFLVIAAEAVMTETRANAGEEIDFKSDFKFGRTTSTRCEAAHGRLPNPEEGCSATNLVFNQFMGLDWKQTAALMAIHPLWQPGYDGWWSDPENSRKFNNNYFVSMLGKSWKPMQTGTSKLKNQWNRNDVGKGIDGVRREMMLDTDMCLVFDVPPAAKAIAESKCGCVWLRSPAFLDAIQANDLENSWCGASMGSFGAEQSNCCPRPPDGNAGSSCVSTAYPKGTAVEAVKLFAQDEDAWILEFMVAWRKATTNGFENSLTPLVTGLWPQFQGDRLKCVFKSKDGDKRRKNILTQDACEALAVSLTSPTIGNFSAYSYDGERKICLVHSECEDYVHTTGGWKIFVKPSPIPAPVVPPVVVYPPIPPIVVNPPIAVEATLPPIAVEATLPPVAVEATLPPIAGEARPIVGKQGSSLLQSEMTRMIEKVEL